MPTLEEQLRADIDYIAIMTGGDTVSVYEMAKSYYARGLWSAERIKALVGAGKLTQKQANEIIGKG